jgi:DNA polymerase III subunit gamma/tau
VATALYRRYRPETFAELIGQSHVTDPLRAALRSDRVNHAYLFSGPRGCGKTTSARILARCLNCAEGPTDTPCGVCPSCVELSRAGGGSLDVVEIDAASHGGVDDARDLRERAAFAPARDRYKIYIIDEAHMVTSGGFNALLKIVEEPPEHIKFIFATTEPEKVIGTIRSRTHHYPFRLVPPAQLLDYVAELSSTEGVTIAPGVLPLVVRAGGGSVRDTLSLLDQLIAGSDDDTVTYERAVALLGYTHGTLLDEVITSIAHRDANSAFHAIDRVIQTGQDPRRFVDDLLERLRDLIVVQATAGDAGEVLRGIPADDLARMHDHAKLFAPADLSKAADVVNRALTEMTGATSPRLHLELMIARVLVTATPGVVATAPASVRASAPVAGPLVSAPVGAAPAAAPAKTPAAAPVAPANPKSAPVVAEAVVAETPLPSERLTIEAIQAVWPRVLDRIQSEKKSVWAIVFTAQPVELDRDDVLTLAFTSESDAARFKERTSPVDSASEHVRNALHDHFGVRVKFKVRLDAPHRPVSDVSTPDSEQPTTDAGTAQAAPAESVPAASEPTKKAPAKPALAKAEPARIEPAAPITGWDVVAIPGSSSAAAPASVPEAPAPVDADAPLADDEPDELDPPSSPTPMHPADAAGRQRYGESVVREVLGARFIGEEVVEPAVSLASPARDGE